MQHKYLINNKIWQGYSSCVNVSEKPHTGQSTRQQITYAWREILFQGGELITLIYS